MTLGERVFTGFDIIDVEGDLQDAVKQMGGGIFEHCFCGSLGGVDVAVT